ncbi:MAG: WYL domain-containing protein [Clostridia bacterium]|nr:WYL domain-containing protein [Clostridia bacterium]
MAANNNAARLFGILEILRKNTDKDHRLSQQEIIRELERMGIKADRKTIKTNILNLIDLGYDINFERAKRSSGKSDANVVCYDYYINNEFDDSELRLLIDSVLYSPNISANQSKQLIEKLQQLSSKYFKSRTRHIAVMPSRKSENKQLFNTIDIIDEAITEKKMISFKHQYYGTDMQLHVARSYNAIKKAAGSEIKWRVSPYQMVMDDGIYYLVCGHMNSKIVHIRLDEILDVEKLDDAAHPINSMIDSEGASANFRTYMKDRIFMKIGSPIRARINVPKLMFHIIPETFGKEVTVISNKGAYADVEVRAPESAIYEFAMKHMGVATVVEPEDVVKKIMSTMAGAFKKYKDMVD